MTIEPIDERHRAGPIAIDARDIGVRYSLRFTRKTTMRTTFTNLFRPRSGRDDVLGAARRLLPPRPGRVAGGHRTERRRQEHAPPGPGRDHHAVDGRGRGRRPRLQPADARGRLRPGAERPRQHPAGRRLPRAWQRRRSNARCRDHRVRRSRPVHRRAAPDLLVGHARPARLRDRDLGRARTSCSSTRSWRPATTTSG